MELYKKYRPTKFNQIKGQKTVVSLIREKLKTNDLPQSLLLTGPTGTGKTTLARIIKTKLGCIDHDYIEINGAESRGIDTVREIKKNMLLAPMGSPCRIWHIDECHQLTNEAQTAFLKILEDTPAKIRFILSTTSHKQLLPTVVGRCMKLELRSLSTDELFDLLDTVLTLEGREVSEDVLEKIVFLAEGSARNCLVYLDQVLSCKDEESQKDCLVSQDLETHGITLARQLMNQKTTWRDITATLEHLVDQPEKTRYIVLGYAAAVLAKKRDDRAYQIITTFRESLIHVGKAGLYANCYEIITKN